MISADILERAAKIKLLVLDVDGVMTDGTIVLDGTDGEYKAFNVRDGHGIKLLQRVGYTVAIITGRRSAVVDRRAKELGIKEVRQKSLNKVVDYEDIIKKYKVKDNEVLYLGDDIVDLPVMLRVGLSVAVADADSEVLKRARWITQKGGGKGAVREVAELLLKAGGHWDGILEKYTEA
jgi:3-deoxy-D-manno-octulosonate 8-phosphate phosphatase (KDO 8-P phosphatase)